MKSLFTASLSLTLIMSSYATEASQSLTQDQQKTVYNNAIDLQNNVVTPLKTALTNAHVSTSPYTYLTGALTAGAIFCLKETPLKWGAALLGTATTIGIYTKTTIIPAFALHSIRTTDRHLTGLFGGIHFTDDALKEIITKFNPDNNQQLNSSDSYTKSLSDQKKMIYINDAIRHMRETVSSDSSKYWKGFQLTDKNAFNTTPLFPKDVTTNRE